MRRPREECEGLVGVTSQSRIGVSSVRRAGGKRRVSDLYGIVWYRSFTCRGLDGRGNSIMFITSCFGRLHNKVMFGKIQREAK